MSDCELLGVGEAGRALSALKVAIVDLPAKEREELCRLRSERDLARAEAAQERSAYRRAIWLGAALRFEREFVALALRLSQ